MYLDEFQDSEQYPVRLKLLTHNMRLIDARRNKGFSQYHLATIVGLPLHILAEIEQLRRSPTRDAMDELASALEVEANWLFPPEILDFKVKTRETYLSAEQLKKISWIKPLELPEPNFDEVALPEVIDGLLDTLKHKWERRVLELRFGLGDNEPKSLEEVSKELGVTRERVRQIEAKALRELRHPSRSRRLKDYVV